MPGEPVVSMVVGLIAAACTLLVVFGVHLSQAQIEALSGFAVAALGLAFYVRSRVTPTRKRARPASRGPVEREKVGW